MHYRPVLICYLAPGATMPKGKAVHQDTDGALYEPSLSTRPSRDDKVRATMRASLRSWRDLQ
jgi:hypothetical protein